MSKVEYLVTTSDMARVSPHLKASIVELILSASYRQLSSCKLYSCRYCFYDIWFCP